jgi:hypothetical protein
MASCSRLLSPDAGCSVVPMPLRRGDAGGEQAEHLALVCEMSLAAVARDMRRLVMATAETRKILSAAEVLSQLATALQQLQHRAGSRRP